MAQISCDPNSLLTLCAYFIVIFLNEVWFNSVQMILWQSDQCIKKMHFPEHGNGWLTIAIVCIFLCIFITKRCTSPAKDALPRQKMQFPTKDALVHGPVHPLGKKWVRKMIPYTYNHELLTQVIDLQRERNVNGSPLHWLKIDSWQCSRFRTY